MKKLVSLVVIAAFAISACGSGSGVVAGTVDGVDVTVGDVESLLDPAEEAITKEQFARFLAFAIQWNVINDKAEEDYGVTVTDAEVLEEADRIFGEVAQDGESREDFLSSRGITEKFFQQIARQGLLEDQIRDSLGEGAPAPTEEELQEQLNLFKAPLTTACVSHILVATEEEAADVFDRLAAGEDFGELAVELSTDTGSGANNGILPCGTLDTYVAPFRDAALVAPVGEVYDTAVESQFGFHVMLVTDRQDVDEADLPTDEEVADAARSASVTVELNEWFLQAMEEAQVTVGEEYGTWQANPPTVVPPTT